MGMYDHFIIDTNRLPVSDEEKENIGNNPGWQTKDFDCFLTEVYVNESGELEINRFEYEVVPKEEREHPNDDGIRGMFGSIRRKNERLEKLKIDAYINFYGDIDEVWYEFRAHFKDGILVEIKREGGRWHSSWD